MLVEVRYKVAKLTHYWTYSTQEVVAEGKSEAECDELVQYTLDRARKEPGVKYAVIVERQVVQVITARYNDNSFKHDGGEYAVC
jgi:hypothetical protein